MSVATFTELGVPSELVAVLDRNLITEPFDIQRLAVPDALTGRDILGRAPTGSGKTLAFGLPMLARLGEGSSRRPRGLILAPTRELAEQISRELEPLAKAMDRKVLSVYGGTGMTKQITALRRGIDLLVACPGRLLDLIEQKAVALSEVDIVVVDEADRMADMGFLPDVKRLLEMTADVRQTVLFSATLDDDVRVLIDRYQTDPVQHEVGEVEPDLSVMHHRFIKVDKSDRIWLAADLIADAGGPAMVFVRTRHGVDRLARQLRQEGIKAGYIHGGRSQSQRDRALQVFTDGKVDVLVATDVAARGIHVDGVACVIHYDPPADAKDYVHRSGRTARAGAAGTVISFLAPPQVKDSRKMQKGLGLEAEVEPLPARQPRSSRPDAIAPDRRQGSSRSKNGARSPKADAKRSDRRNSSRKKADGNRSEKKRAGSNAASAGRDAEVKPSDKKRSGSKADGKPSERSRARTKDDGRKIDEKPSRRKSDAKRVDAKRSDRKSPDGKRSERAKSDGKRSERAKSDGKRSERATGERKPSAGKAAAERKPTAGKASAKRSAGKKSNRRPGSSSTSRPASAGGTSSSGHKRKAAAAGAGPKRAKSKRSGKPRPKNRKNKPASGRR